MPLDPTLALGEYDVPGDVYIDPETILVSQLNYPIRAPADLTITLSITVNYADYKTAQGVVVPFNVVYSANGLVLRNQVVTSVAINVATTNNTFSVGTAQ